MQELFGDGRVFASRVASANEAGGASRSLA